MQARDRDALELEIHSRSAAGDTSAAVAAAIAGYGPEIFGFLVALHRDEDDAREVFSMFAERLLRGLPGFAWTSSFRTWAYAIARNTSLSYRVDARRRARREAPIDEGSPLFDVAEAARTATLSFLKTKARDRIAELRDALPEDDRVLLSLRIDKRMSWADLAQVLHDGDQPLGDDAIRRESARLRKQFQYVKERLVAKARADGIVPASRRQP